MTRLLDIGENEGGSQLDEDGTEKRRFQEARFYISYTQIYYYYPCLPPSFFTIPVYPPICLFVVILCFSHVSFICLIFLFSVCLYV